MPEGWTNRQLDTLGHIGTGNTPPTSDARYFGGEFMFATPGDLGGAKNIERTERTLTKVGLGKSRQIPAGSTLFVCIGATIGKVGVAIKTMAANQQINYIVPGADVDPHFLYHALLQKAPYVRRLAGESALPIISKSDFGSSVDIPLPTLAEQRRIAAVLDTWDDAIGAAGRLFNLRSRQIGAIAERIFSASFDPEPPRGWSRLRLEAAFTERDERGGVGRLLSITAEQGIIDREEVGRKDTSNEDKSAYKRIRPGDIGYNTMRMWQGVSALSRLEGLVSPAYTVVIPRKPINPHFAAHLFKQPRMINRFWRYSQGLVDDTLNLKFPNFAQIVVNLPPIQSQQEIAALLDNLSGAGGVEKHKAALLRRQKRGLAQKLLTGEWRVPATGNAFTPGGPAADRLEAAE